MKRWHRGGAATVVAIVASTLIMLAAGFPAQAQDGASGQVAPEAVWNRWFVELKSPPTADGSSLATVRAEKNAFRKEASRAGLSFRERYAFDVLWNGLSIEIDSKKAATLARIPGVKAVYPVETLRLPENAPGDSAELATALAMTGANIAQSALGLSGQGVKVAVMDTGIDYDHPDLGGCFGPGCRVVTGFDFVGDDFNADSTSPSFNPVPTPDPLPDDCNGHGSHVAGIIGASGDPLSGGARGVAPGVTFGAYRVFGCEGSTTADIMVAAMERALADGMHILNMSIGSAFQWPQYPTAQAADRLVNRGMSVVASIGNSGASGLYTSSAPGVGAKVIGVASFDNTHVELATFTVVPDGRSIGYGPATGAPAAPTSGSLAMARTGTATSAADACTASGPLPAGLGGKAVLIRRGTCSFYEKAFNAQNAGAAAVVLYNNVAGRVSPTVAGSPPITIPVVAISDTEGVFISNSLAAGPVTMTWTTQSGTFVNPTGNLVSSFSSFGLSPDLTLKPDISAPGGLIRSTWPLELGGYATISGTSMASPHTAGAVALLLEARPNTPSNAVRGILQNSADPKRSFLTSAFLENVHRQGAGMLDVPGAVQSTTGIEPSKLALGESEAGPATRTLTLTNKGSADVTYDVSHSPALSTGPNAFTPAFFTGFASASFSAPVVTVPAGGSASVDVIITANPGLADKSLFGGYVVFTPQGGGAVYRVPYSGLKGDYQSIRVLAPTANGFPWLTREIGGLLNKIPPASATFTMVGADIPIIAVHLDHQSQKLRVEVLDAASGKSWHRAMELDHLPRNATATGIFGLPWDGVTVAGNRAYVVPNGSYILRMSVLKALGDAANPAHWETWDSPAFTIARP